MMEYKVCFHMSYKNPDGTHLGNGKLHYCGHTLEEAIEKALNISMVLGFRPSTGRYTTYICTSFAIQRGRRRGENVKWEDYKKTTEGKTLIKNTAPVMQEIIDLEMETFGWQYLD